MQTTVGAQPAVYRAALKLRSLQKYCLMYKVKLQPLDHTQGPESRVSRKDAAHHLQMLFQRVLLELSEEGITLAIKNTSRLLFKLYDREETGFITLRSLEALIIALSGDTLPDKHMAIFHLAKMCSENKKDDTVVNQSGVRAVLIDITQVTSAVQERHLFGEVDAAIESCFKEKGDELTQDQFVAWLNSEPPFLLWLTALCKMTAGETMIHAVQCHVCKANPFTGLRYRCLKCINLHVCQDCFLARRDTQKHKTYHPVLDVCAQPTVQESIQMLAHNLRHRLRWKRSARQEGASGVTTPQLSFAISLPYSQESKGTQTGVVSHSQKKALPVGHDLQTDHNSLRKHKGLREEFEAWKTAAQSECNMLKDKCGHLEASIEVLAQQNHNLQEELRRARLLLETISKQVTKTSSNVQKEMLQAVAQHNSSEPDGLKAIPVKVGPGRAPVCKNTPPEASLEELEKVESDKAGDDMLQSIDKLEEQLLCLVQRLQGDFSPQYASPEETPDSTGDLLEAAEGVGDSVSRVVHSVSSSDCL